MEALRLRDIAVADDLALLPPVMLAKSMPKKLSDLTIAGNANARPSVISDRYSPRIRSAGIPMTAPTAKRARRRPGVSPGRPTVVGDQDHRRVGTDAEERGVADRDLPGVTGDDVQAEDRDGEGERDRHRLALKFLGDVGDEEEDAITARTPRVGSRGATATSVRR
jgi:hypothetical protein